jgi:hypothetical protein
MLRSRGLRVGYPIVTNCSGDTARAGNARRTSRSSVTRGTSSASASATYSQSYAVQPDWIAKARTSGDATRAVAAVHSVHPVRERSPAHVEVDQLICIRKLRVSSRFAAQQTPDPSVATHRSGAPPIPVVPPVLVEKTPVFLTNAMVSWLGTISRRGRRPFALAGTGGCSSTERR